MDPQETLNELVMALRNEDWKSAEQNAADLQEWCDKGGFPPHMSNSQMAKILEFVIHFCIHKS